MTGTTKKKRSTITAPRRPTTRDKHLKELIKEAVREVLQEERTGHGTEQPFPAGRSREELVALALLARDRWQESESMGNSIDMINWLQHDWKPRPN